MHRLLVNIIHLPAVNIIFIDDFTGKVHRTSPKSVNYKAHCVVGNFEIKTQTNNNIVILSLDHM